MKLIVRMLPVATLLALAACHSDPFGVKPEVRGVEIPDKPAEDGEDSAPENETPARKTPT